MPVGPTKVGIHYALAGFLSALGGCVATFYMQSGNPASFVGLELDAIAAVVIAGTSLTGGLGFVPGTLMGVLILGLIRDAVSLPTDVTTPEYKAGDKAIPSVHASASRDQAGRVHLSVVNLQPQQTETVTVALKGAALKDVQGQVLTGPTLDSHNTFEAPDTVKPAAFTAFELGDDALTLTLPARSVVVLSLN